ncbi:MAG TPA: peptide chain release factor N(5)-glutamine methyltransferase [Solirubrobacteraceae bacterium]
MTPAGGTTTARAVSVRDALDGACVAIAAGGSPSARLDAELLLADVLGVRRGRLHSHPEAPVQGPAVRAFQSFVRRRSVLREPVAYILGRQAFRRIELAVDPRVLIPRPETEHLVEVGLELPPGARVLDLATGSGAVALALADERPDLRVSGSDRSRPALSLARSNAVGLGLEVDWQEADLLDGLSGEWDAILCNPPYIPTDVLAGLEPEVSTHEPVLALDGGPDGLDVIRRLIDQVAVTATPLVGLEVGAGQAAAVVGLLGRAGFPRVETRRDLAGIERVIVARR